MLLCKAAVRGLVKDLRPGTRVSGEYIEVLEAKLRGIIVRHAQANGGKKTLKSDVFLGLPARGKR